MYTNPFTYRRPKTLEEAVSLFESAEDAAFVSGGHTLIPAMKSRLAAPEVLIDVRAIPDLHGIVRDGNRLIIGAATTHFSVSTAGEIQSEIPALAHLAGSIADIQVRHMGTIGGSLANNDPAADYPSAILSLNAAIITDRGVYDADSFFDGLFTTALERGEIITRVSIPIPECAGYAKFRSQASRYAMAGSFVSKVGESVRVAVTGAGNDGVFRWTQAEDALAADFSVAALEGMQPEADDMIDDMHGAADYRAHLVGAVTRHAVDNVGGIYIR